MAADCLQTATSVEAIGQLKGLRSLGVGIFRLETFDFLAHLDSSELTELSLYATRSRRPSLRVIERFGGLKQLFLDGQHKDIDVIARLKGIGELTLRSVTLKSLAMLRDLPKLWSLDIRLGGCSDLAPLLAAPSLEEVACFDGSNFDPKEFEAPIEGGRVKRLAVGLGSDRNNAMAGEMMREHGVEAFKSTPFTWA